MAPAGFAGSVIIHTVPLTVLAAEAFGPSTPAWWFVIVSLLLRWLTAGIIARRLALPIGGLWLLPLRDALSFVVFLGSFFGRNRSWRGPPLRGAAGGRR